LKSEILAFRRLAAYSARTLNCHGPDNCQNTTHKAVKLQTKIKLLEMCV